MEERKDIYPITVEVSTLDINMVEMSPFISDMVKGHSLISFNESLPMEVDSVISYDPLDYPRKKQKALLNKVAFD